MAVVDQPASGGRPETSLRADVIAALPAGLGVAVLVAWSTDQGGYFARSWYPGALALLALLLVAIFADRGSFRGLSRATQLALAALGLFTLWAYLSLLWASDKGVAWDGANRTLMYLVVFVLFTRSVGGARPVAIVLGVWVAAITLLAVLVLVELPGMLGGGPPLVTPGLGQPFGYANANAAIWLMALWPALLFASCRTVPPALRGLAAGAVVVLAETSLLSESRGSLGAAAVVLVVMFVVVPSRIAIAVTLLPAAAGIALISRRVLDLADEAARDPAAVAPLGEAAGLILPVALAVALTVFAAATVALRWPADARRARLTRRAGAALGAGLALAAAAGALTVTGDPIERVRTAWTQFSSETAPTPDSAGRLTSGFGGARYDYYSVTLDVFAEHRVIGIGMDNFAEDYLARGRAGERPTSPHSLELRTLLQTGVVGAILLLAALEAGFAATASGLRGTSTLARATAAGGALCALYWVTHGSIDWFWEFPALGGAAFAALGLAGAAGRRPAKPVAGRSWAAVAGIGLAAVAAAVTFTLPWAADVEVRRAEASWVVYPGSADRQLDLAKRLNPLSARPRIVEGHIAIKRGDVAGATRAFEEALRRSPRSAYATLWLGAIASHRGQRERAARLLREAVRLAPTDPPTLSAMDQSRAGRIDLQALDRQLEDFAGQLVQG